MLRYWIVAAALVVPGAASAQAEWTGFYVGPELGAANARLSVSGNDIIYQLSNERPGPGGTSGPIIVVPATTRAFSGTDNQVSLLYGGFAGAQWQTGSLVLGVEGDIHGGRDAGRFSTTESLPPTLLAPVSTVTLTREARIRYDWSARARIGLVTGQSLLYATGGVAQTRMRLTGEDSFFTPAGAAAPNSQAGVPTFMSPTIGPVVVTVTQRANLTGWTAGAGGERRLGQHLSFGLDARYVDYGSHTITFRCGDGGPQAGFVAIRNGSCANGTYSTPPIVINGRTHDNTDATPGAEPGPTRISLSEWRLALRLSWRFF